MTDRISSASFESTVARYKDVAGSGRGANAADACGAAAAHQLCLRVQHHSDIDAPAAEWPAILDSSCMGAIGDTKATIPTVNPGLRRACHRVRL